MSAYLPDLVLQSLEPGKPVTDDALAKTLSRLALMGESDGSGWFSDSETYAEALRGGRAEEWMPEPTDEQRARAIEIMRQKAAERGISLEPSLMDKVIARVSNATEPPFTDEAIARVVKEEVLGIRYRGGRR